MAEDLAEFLAKNHVKVRYMHSEIDGLQRTELIRQLRLGEFDVLVGINLLREGLDIPEVSLVAILDADKEGFLRNNTSLIQTFGRAARNIDGMVIMYADTITDWIAIRLLLLWPAKRFRFTYCSGGGAAWGCRPGVFPAAAPAATNERPVDATRGC